MSQPNESARGAVLSLRECAEATGVSYSTIKRRQSDFTHAYRDRGGVWRVPVSDLLGAGLKLRASSAEPVSQAHEPPVNGVELAQARDEIQGLKLRLAVAETEARLLAASVDDLRLSLRALTGRPAAPEASGLTHRESVASAAPEPVQAPPPVAQVMRNASPRRGPRAWFRRS